MGDASKKLILAAMIFAVSMTFIDMTIVAIAVLVSLIWVPAGKVEQVVEEPGGS
ncbi:MAG TPA: hypothetical protein VFK14_12225 [Solirubrobacterales bacterium]|nr:hypothetical protein [Solirubrobacterales bacterium]